MVIIWTMSSSISHKMDHQTIESLNIFARGPEKDLLWWCPDMVEGERVGWGGGGGGGEGGCREMDHHTKYSNIFARGPDKDL